MTEIPCSCTRPVPPRIDAEETGHIGPFRVRALRAAEQQAGTTSEPLHLEPVWMRRASWLFYTTTVLALLAAFIAVKGWFVG